MGTNKYSKHKMCPSKDDASYVLSNTLAAFEAQFMKKLSNTKAELIKSVAYKKSVFFLNVLN